MQWCYVTQFAPLDGSYETHRMNGAGDTVVILDRHCTELDDAAMTKRIGNNKDFFVSKTVHLPEKGVFSNDFFTVRLGLWHW